MTEIYRPDIRIGKCTTSSEYAAKIGLSDSAIRVHKTRTPGRFPKPVAQFGGYVLYIESELEAFYEGIKWRRADMPINKAIGE